MGRPWRLSVVNKQRLSPIPTGAISRAIVLFTLVENLSRGVHPYESPVEHHLLIGSAPCVRGQYRVEEFMY